MPAISLWREVEDQGQTSSSENMKSVPTWKVFVRRMKRQKLTKVHRLLHCINADAYMIWYWSRNKIESGKHWRVSSLERSSQNCVNMKTNTKAPCATLKAQEFDTNQSLKTDFICSVSTKLVVCRSHNHLHTAYGARLPLQALKKLRLGIETWFWPMGHSWACKVCMH